MSCYSLSLDAIQETESSLKRMQERMEEAEQRMIQDDVTADDMLQIVSTEEFPRPKGESPDNNTCCTFTHIHPSMHCTVCDFCQAVEETRKIIGSMSGDAILSDHVSITVCTEL